MAPNFGILAWEIPWTEEPGRLQSMGSQKSQLFTQVAKVLEFRFNISPSNEYSGLISFKIGWFDLLAVHLILC